ncbi:MAG: ATP-binding protein [Pseudomonadota bacterium]|nr:ATP-binding protein [Pseudomonadota bacterium]
MDASRPSLLMLRWLALGAAAGAALTLLMAHLELNGPWETVALVLTLLAGFAIAGVIVLMRRREQLIDETDRRARQSEEEKSELQRELDRHTQLETQLRQAKQAAESAVMAKGEFLATMSHEIRTPLNGIVPMLDLLMHARLAPDHAEMVRTAYTSSQQMLRIVDDILDYSKLEANKLVLEATTFNLRELLEGVMQLMERPAQSKGLRLNLQIDASVRLSVRGDPVRLRQVIGNLVSNAVKFTERGSVVVSVRRIGETTAQHQLRFEVRDTGIGIAPASQSRLFQAFNQADASTTRLYGGTGLGLAISKRIVDLMGGRISVDSEHGHGATFWFEVPLLKVHGDIRQPDVAASGRRVLLLSTDPRLRLRLALLLPNWGLRVTSVETTQEALDRLRTAANQGEPWTYSIVLADLAGMRSTSVALHRNLGRHDVYGNTRLVCLYGDDPVAEELQQNATLLSRQGPDADLRVALMSDRADADAANPGDQGPMHTVASTAPTLPDGSTTRAARVLLVEDNPVNLMVGQRLLSVLGITCDTAGNGETALMRMSSSRYDVVLMDCQMPVMDGYTATRRWRECESAAGDGHHLPIIAMTANAMAGDRQKCLDAGMDDYLPKPVTRSELERCLHRWWKPESVASGVAAPRALDGAPQAHTEADTRAPPSEDGGNRIALPEPVADATAPTPPQPVHPTVAGPWAPPAEPPQAAAPSVAAEQAPAPPPVIDQEVLVELRSLLGSDVDHLIDVFLEDTPRILAALESAAIGPDYDALRDAAHSLKSSSANLGAMSLSAASRRVEQGARQRTLKHPAVAVALVCNEYARAKQALQDYAKAGVT